MSKSGRRSGASPALAEEGDLIRRCLAGERSAEEQFYARFRSQVAANLFRVLGNRIDLDDLVQEVFVIAFRGLPKFRGEARISTWLYRICANVAMGRIRTKARRPPPILMADPVGETTASSAVSPERALQQRQARDRVYRILDQLPPKKRLVFYLHEIEGRDLKEVAYIVQANPVTVRTRLFYARKEFYRLAAEGDDS